MSTLASNVHRTFVMGIVWPPLPLDDWRATRETLHRYAQVIGKVQLALTPAVCHFWNVALHVTARGLMTPALRSDGRTFDIELDFLDHQLRFRTSDGRRLDRALRPLAVADFYRETMAALDALGVHVTIDDHPVELRSERIPLSQDRVHDAYDREAVERFFRVLSNACQALEQFRARFLGKASEVGFYWGTFDLAASRYSGRRAPDPGGGIIEREAFSHEVSEVGFWPGDAVYAEPAFYALHYPAPDGYARAAVRPPSAYWFEPSRCFVLPYETCRREPDPVAQILDFCQSTYEAGANLASWDRAELEQRDSE